MENLKEQRIKIQDEYLRLFTEKHDYGDSYISGDLICFHDGYYAFSWELIYFDIDNNCKAEEPFKLVDWLMDNEDCRINYETWISLGGSENQDNIKEILNKKHEDDIEDCKKSKELISKILDDLINGD